MPAEGKLNRLTFFFLWIPEEIFSFKGDKKKMNKALRKIVLTAMLTALAVTISIIIKLIPGLNISFPNGGSVFGLYTLPLVLIGMILGYKYGILGGLIYGMVSWMLDGYFLHWGSIFLDYLIPFSLVAAAGGIFGKKSLDHWVYFAVVFIVAFFLRWMSHGFSGLLFFADYTPEGTAPWFYSFILYNLPYVFTSSSISLLIGLVIRKQIKLLANTLD